MSAVNPTISNYLYQSFQKISVDAWSDIIRFYELNKNEIDSIDPKEKIEIQYLYIKSLHEVRDYQKVIDYSMSVIDLSISDQIPLTIGKKCYQDCLFWRANALIKRNETEEASHILKQLKKIDPTNIEYQHKLMLSIYTQKPKWVQMMKAMSILCFLGSALIILFEILIVSNFFSHQLIGIQLMRNLLFVFAILLAIGANFAHAYRSYVKSQKE